MKEGCCGKVSKSKLIVEDVVGDFRVVERMKCLSGVCRNSQNCRTLRDRRDKIVGVAGVLKIAEILRDISLS